MQVKEERVRETEVKQKEEREESSGRNNKFPPAVVKSRWCVRVKSVYQEFS